MPRAKSVEVVKDGPQDLEAKIIRAIGAAGPRNVAQISRMTGAHQETIRYKIKKRFGRFGFKFHAEVDFDKLGLRLHWASLNFAKAYYPTAPQILRALNEVGYLTYYAKVVPQGNYVSLFALPQDATGQYNEFLARLVDRGILGGFSLKEVRAERHKVMDPHFFNFRSGRWEVEWDRVTEQPAMPLPPDAKTRPADFDYYDLLVIKELQKDSLQHLTGIARKLKVHQKTLEYHYRTHVQKWKLVPSYRIRWAQDMAKKVVHQTALMRMAFHDLGQPEFIKIQAAMSKMPFLWAEDFLQDGSYVATMYVPSTDIVHTMSYISESIPNLASKVDVAFVKHSEAASFTIPYNMYQKGEWKFDIRKMENALREASNTPLQK